MNGRFFRAMQTAPFFTFGARKTQRSALNCGIGILPFFGGNSRLQAWTRRRGLSGSRSHIELPE